MADQPRSAPQRTRKYGPHAIATIGRQRWLDRPSYRLEHALTLIFAAFGRRRERVSNILHGTWLGHPLHPALTALRTGAVATAVALDAASVLPGNSAALRDASRLALGVGIIGSLGAVATGATDWQHTHEESRRVGMPKRAATAEAAVFQAVPSRPVKMVNPLPNRSNVDTDADRPSHTCGARGVEPGTAAGVPNFDHATLGQKIKTYVDGPRWTPHYVAFSGVTVLVIVVEVAKTR
jgi:hypothetical protein